MNRFIWLMSIVILGTVSPGIRAAEPATTRTLTTNGSASVSLPPERMQLVALMKARGSGVKEAFGHLKQQQQQVRQALLSLGADEKSIEFTSTTIGDAAASPVRAVRFSIPGVPGAPAVDGAPAEPKLLPIQCIVKAEWKLSGTTTEELLIGSSEIREKVKSVKFDAPTAELSPEEAELAEEMAAQHYGNEPSGPQFQFQAVLSLERQKKALSDAYAAAVKKADALADAANVQRGAIIAITAEASAGNPYSHPSRAYAHLLGASPMLEESPPVVADSMTVSGPSIDAVSFHVGVQTQFALEDR